jgi:hypothetical protein
MHALPWFSAEEIRTLVARARTWYGEDDSPEDASTALEPFARLYIPCTRASWLVIGIDAGDDGELGDDPILVVLADLGLGPDCAEFGTIFASELRAGAFGIPAVRQRDFHPEGPANHYLTATRRLGYLPATLPPDLRPAVAQRAVEGGDG